MIHDGAVQNDNEWDLKNTMEKTAQGSCWVSCPSAAARDGYANYSKMRSATRKCRRYFEMETLEKWSFDQSASDKV